MTLNEQKQFDLLDSQYCQYPTNIQFGQYINYINNRYQQYNYDQESNQLDDVNNQLQNKYVTNQQYIQNDNPEIYLTCDQVGDQKQTLENQMYQYVWPVQCKHTKRVGKQQNNDYIIKEDYMEGDWKNMRYNTKEWASRNIQLK
ncbi:Hypothetical_protein [Hexamita inflata]|uniref:Hypothetical_protein n=1 Tax=Hexamita inflata TaxID=28002 RepID=A0AA86V1T0_9EUKA|nr:Hypothetical protein HINF_LOCUS64949 [Hexamita inflata]